MLFIIFKFFGHYAIKLNNSNCKRFRYFLVPVSQGNLGYLKVTSVMPATLAISLWVFLSPSKVAPI